MGGWVWLKSHLDLVSRAEKSAMGLYGGVSFGDAFRAGKLPDQLPAHFKVFYFDQLVNQRLLSLIKQSNLTFEILFSF